MGENTVKVLDWLRRAWRAIEADCCPIWTTFQAEYAELVAEPEVAARVEGEG